MSQVSQVGSAYCVEPPLSYGPPLHIGYKILAVVLVVTSLAGMILGGFKGVPFTEIRFSAKLSSALLSGSICMALTLFILLYNRYLQTPVYLLKPSSLRSPSSSLSSTSTSFNSSSLSDFSASSSTLLPPPASRWKMHTQETPSGGRVITVTKPVVSDVVQYDSVSYVTGRDMSKLKIIFHFLQGSIVPIRMTADDLHQVNNRFGRNLQDGNQSLMELIEELDTKYAQSMYNTEVVIQCGRDVVSSQYCIYASVPLYKYSNQTPTRSPHLRLIRPLEDSPRHREWELFDFETFWDQEKTIKFNNFLHSLDVVFSTKGPDPRNFKQNLRWKAACISNLIDQHMQERCLVIYPLFFKTEESLYTEGVKIDPSKLSALESICKQAASAFNQFFDEDAFLPLHSLLRKDAIGGKNVIFQSILVELPTIVNGTVQYMQLKYIHHPSTGLYDRPYIIDSTHGLKKWGVKKSIDPTV